MKSCSLSQPGIIDARARYRAAARQLRNTALGHYWSTSSHSETPSLSLVSCYPIFLKLIPIPTTFPIPPDVPLRQIQIVAILLSSERKISHLVRIDVVFSVMSYGVLINSLIFSCCRLQ
jgi:hypothetical protein